MTTTIRDQLRAMLDRLDAPLRAPEPTSSEPAILEKPPILRLSGAKPRQAAPQFDPINDVRPFAKRLLDRGLVTAKATPEGNRFVIDHGFQLETLADWRVFVQDTLGWNLSDSDLALLRGHLVKMTADAETDRRADAHRFSVITRARMGCFESQIYCMMRGWSFA